MVAAGLPLVAQTMPQLADDGVELYANIQYMTSWDNAGSSEFPDNSAGLFRIPAGSSEALPVNVPIVTNGLAYYNGKAYMNVGGQWQIHDLATGEVTSSPTSGGSTSALSYDVVNGVMYGIRNTDGGYVLATIDMETGEMTDLGGLSEYVNGEPSGQRLLSCNAMAIDNYGQIFVVYSRYVGNNNVIKLGRILPQRYPDRLIYVGDVALADSPATMYNWPWYSLLYNHKSGIMYYTFCGQDAAGTGCTPIFEMNTNNGVATTVGYLSGDGYAIRGAFFAEPEFSAPDGVDMFEYKADVDADPNLLTGTLSIELPSVTYGGAELTGELTVVVNDGDEELFRLAGRQPGETVVTDLRSFGYGEHTFSCYVIDGNGIEGLVREFTVYIGYDVPTAPQNVTIEEVDGQVVLSWDAPNEGQHGNPVQAEGIEYRITDAFDTHVANLFGTTTYSIPVASELTNHSYYITAYYQGVEGGRAGSPTLYTGDPLDAPYTTDFTDMMEVWNGYKIIDANGDGYTWMWYTVDRPYVMCLYDPYWEHDADDWIFTPPVNYQAGKTYCMKVTAQSSNEGYPEVMQVTFGSDREIAAQTDVLELIPAVPAKATTYSYKVTPTSDGVYYFGFHCMTPAREGEYLLLSALEIYDEDNPPASVDEVDSATGVKAWGGDGIITIANTTGEAAKVYAIGGTLVATSADEHFTATLPAGVYVVKCGGMAVKAIVN